LIIDNEQEKGETATSCPFTRSHPTATNTLVRTTVPHR
jgi:hypothetical protein